MVGGRNTASSQLEVVSGRLPYTSSLGALPLSEPQAPHQSNGTNDCPYLSGEAEVRPGHIAYKCPRCACIAFRAQRVLAVTRSILRERP